ncbi:MAG: hypothetical protein M3O01_00795 [Pseudomonadota bacterium]|nr:hypothetical protein [Pseudomonadota bacterium]
MTAPAEATLPAGSRKLTTAWHPDWRLRVRVAEPGRLTTDVYNGQPDPYARDAIAVCAPPTALLPDGKPIAVLCRRVEQATTDVDGHLGLAAAPKNDLAPRGRSWTYDQDGQVLTATDPLGRSTRHAYHARSGADATRGDLQSTTNPAGQTTTFDRFNAHGQVEQRTDPNGVMTTLAYDARQRLASRTAAGQTTRYAYNAAGQLTTTTLPNGAAITNTYDPAQRLVQVEDAVGNKLTYTLDAAGNRIGEQLQDSGGTPLRTIKRSFDALNRLQSVTGAPK